MIFFLELFGEVRVGRECCWGVKGVLVCQHLTFSSGLLLKIGGRGSGVGILLYLEFLEK